MLLPLRQKGKKKEKERRKGKLSCFINATFWQCVSGRLTTFLPPFMLIHPLLVSSSIWVVLVAALEVLDAKKIMKKKNTVMVTVLKKLIIKQEITIDHCMCGINA